MFCVIVYWIRIGNPDHPENLMDCSFVPPRHKYYKQILDPYRNPYSENNPNNPQNLMDSSLAPRNTSDKSFMQIRLL